MGRTQCTNAVPKLYMVSTECLFDPRCCRSPLARLSREIKHTANRNNTWHQFIADDDLISILDCEIVFNILLSSEERYGYHTFRKVTDIFAKTGTRDWEFVIHNANKPRTSPQTLFTMFVERTNKTGRDHQSHHVLVVLLF